MQTVQIENKTIHIVSTAHVSKESVLEVKEAIDTLRPDVVCIELDHKRAHALENPSKEDIDIKEIIKQKKLISFAANLILANYQKKIADDLDTQVGAEMLQAINSAHEHNIPLRYIDRDVQVTLKRIWNPLSLWKKATLGVGLAASLFSKEEISEDHIEELKQDDLLLAAIKDLDESFPEVSNVILHERNIYMAQRIRELPYDNILVVIGAAHAPGMIEALDTHHDISDFDTIIESKSHKFSGFIIPALVVALLVLVTFKSPTMGFKQLTSWIILSSTLSGIGALLAFAHPITILISIATAWIGIMSPVLAVGMFAALSESYFRPPLASEFATLSEDVSSIKGWYRNRVLKILLVFILTTLLSSVGTLISTTNIIKSLIELFN